MRVCLAIGLVTAAIAFAPTGPAEAREGNRTLKLHFGHTGERGEFTFKKNGRYDRKELDKINRLLRDWRRNEPARMDPQLLDLIWAIYKQAGGRDYIHVVSAYRSPATNNMLRSRSSGVAKNSQHTLGKAMDFYIPGVKIDKLRAVAMKAQGGGVGYYPKSGSPFVHVDTGNVRAWPRMSRKQLIALFPNGDTLHLPSDGKPLPGYERALAKRKTGGTTALAYLEMGDDEERRGDKPTVGGWLKRVFDGGADEAEDNAEAGVAAKPAAPAETPAPSTEPVEPVAGEPTILIAASEPATEPRLPRARPGEQLLALATEPGGAPEQLGTTAETAWSFAPLPKSRPDSAVLAASLGSAEAGPAALAIDAGDAIAALAGRAGESSATEAVDADTRIAAALGTPAAAPALPSAADSAIIAGFSAIEDEPAPVPSALTALAAAAALGEVKASAPMPRARPVVLAFAGIGLPSAPAPEAAPAPATAAPIVQEASVAAAATVSPEPAYDGDAAALIELIATPAAHDASYARFEMPQPAGAADLFAVPDSAAAIVSGASDPQPPTDRFELSRTDTNMEPAQESFFSRLFANLVE